MKTPIFDVLDKYKEHISFHTPAHSGVVSLYDVTELSYSDNMIEPSGAILQSEKMTSEAYSAENTTYITSGATTAIHIAMAVFKGGRFLLFGDAHKSHFSGARAFAGEAYYSDDGANLAATIASLKPDAVIVTSPNYFGETLDLAQIKDACNASGSALIVDAAHGSHFMFCSKLPISATEYGDLVIHSLHKTLPVVTGGAVLHYKNEYASRVAFALSEIHSSSPSYPTMMSIEGAVATMASKGEKLWSEVIDGVAYFKSKLVVTPYEAEEHSDPTRLVLSSPFDAHSVAALLETKGIYAEAAYRNRLIFIVTPYNFAQLPKLFDALCEIMPKPFAEDNNAVFEKKGLKKLVLDGNWESVPYEKAEDRTLYREIGLYPPGTPCILGGDKLSADKIQFIKNNYNYLFGLDKGCVFVLK